MRAICAEAVDQQDRISGFRPGNFRELHNVLRHALILSEGGNITPDHLPEEFAAVPVNERAHPGGKRLQLESLLESAGAVEQDRTLAMSASGETQIHTPDVTGCDFGMRCTDRGDGA